MPRFLPQPHVGARITADRLADDGAARRASNRDGRLCADASRSSWFMFGAGRHMVWIDPDHGAVVVGRWLDGAHSARFVHLVAQALGNWSPT